MTSKTVFLNKVSEMDEFVIEFEFPEFTTHKFEKFLRIGIRKDSSKNQLVSAKIFPDEDEPENKGHVSIVISILRYIPYNVATRFVTPISSFQCTVSLVDINEELRFAQSFGVDFQHKSVFGTAFKIKKFISRSVLLDNREELLPEDKLTLRCDVVCCYKNIQNIKEKEEAAKRPLLNAIVKSESWFVTDDDPEEDCRPLDLRNADSPLCTRLQEKSEYFKALFRWPGKEMENGRMPVYSQEHYSFFDMLWYVRFEKLDHVLSIEEYCRLYEMGAKYGVLDLQEKCSSYLKQHLTPDCVIGNHMQWTYNRVNYTFTSPDGEIGTLKELLMPSFAIATLRIADSNNDMELRAVVFRCILSNWRDDVKVEAFSKLGLDLRNQVMCAVRILNLEDGASGTLCYLAGRQVHMNRDIVQNSPTWAIFTRKLPDVAEVILSLGSGGYTLGDLDDKELTENNEEEAVSYDFYR